jgi:hypothetical protein
VATDSFVAQPVVVNLAAVSVEEILPGAIVWEGDVYPLIKRGKVQHHHKTLQNAAVVCAPAMKDGDILQLIIPKPWESKVRLPSSYGSGLKFWLRRYVNSDKDSSQKHRSHAGSLGIPLSPPASTLKFVS